MINNNLYNKPNPRPVVAPKAKAAGRLFLKLHIMPRVATNSLQKWLILGIAVVVILVIAFFAFYS